MKRANTAIVQQPHLQDSGCDVTGNSIWENENFCEKIVDVGHNEYQGSDDVTDDEDFDKSEFGQEGDNGDNE